MADGLERFFKLQDKNRDGAVSVEELAACLKHGGYTDQDIEVGYTCCGHIRAMSYTCIDIWCGILIYGSGGSRGGGRGDHPPPLVAENFVCSNSNFSPTGAITPPPLSGPPWPSPPPSENPVSAPVWCGILIYGVVY